MPEPGTSRARRGYWSNPGTQPWSSWGYAPAGPGWSQYANSPYSPVAARPQLSGNFLGSLWSRQANQPVYGAPGYGGRGTMNPVQAAREAYFASLQNQPAPASYYGWNQLSSYVPATGTTMAPGWEAPAPSDNNYYRDALLRMANAYNRWGDYIGGGIDYRLSPLNIANINAIPAGGDYSKGFNQLNRWGQPLGTKGSPAPVIGGSRKMSWAGQTKAKKNWHPGKFANLKTSQMSAPNPLAAAAMGGSGVGLVYGNANWGRP